MRIGVDMSLPFFAWALRAQYACREGCIVRAIFENDVKLNG
jgi:hypothetical protein